MPDTWLDRAGPLVYRGKGSGAVRSRHDPLGAGGSGAFGYQYCR